MAGVTAETASCSQFCDESRAVEMVLRGKWVMFEGFDVVSVLM